MLAKLHQQDQAQMKMKILLNKLWEKFYMKKKYNEEESLFDIIINVVEVEIKVLKFTRAISKN